MYGFCLPRELINLIRNEFKETQQKGITIKNSYYVRILSSLYILHDLLWTNRKEMKPNLMPQSSVLSLMLDKSLDILLPSLCLQMIWVLLQVKHSYQKLIQTFFLSSHPSCWNDLKISTTHFFNHFTPSKVLMLVKCKVLKAFKLEKIRNNSHCWSSKAIRIGWKVSETAA